MRNFTRCWMRPPARGTMPRCSGTCSTGTRYARCRRAGWCDSAVTLAGIRGCGQGSTRPSCWMKCNGSADAIEQRLGVRPSLFCYPNGDFDAVALELAAGEYVAALSTEPGWNGADSPLHHLRRVGLHEDVSSHPPDCTTDPVGPSQELPIERTILAQGLPRLKVSQAARRPVSARRRDRSGSRSSRITDPARASGSPTGESSPAPVSGQQRTRTLVGGCGDGDGAGHGF